MNGRAISDGVWAAMITPYMEDGKIDFHGVQQVIDWYDRQGVNGIFSVCMSSEMHRLSLEERAALADYVVRNTPKHMNVVVSGHISQDLDEQILELRTMAETKPDALVLVTNCIAKEEESDEVWKANCEKILESLPEVPLGLYECPIPYRRWLNPELLKWCADTGRFVFMKEGSCNVDTVIPKLEAIKGSRIRMFAAETINLSRFLKAGVSGYCGIYANMWPQIYTHMIFDKEKDEEQTEFLQEFASLVSLVAKMVYPPCAKYYLALEGLDIRPESRNSDAGLLDDMDKQIIRQVHTLLKNHNLSRTLFSES